MVALHKRNDLEFAIILYPFESDTMAIDAILLWMTSIGFCKMDLQVTFVHVVPVLLL